MRLLPWKDAVSGNAVRLLIGAFSFVLLGHAPLDYETMKPRELSSNVKTSIAGIETLPCGPGINNQPGAVQHTITAGSQFELTFVETIDHPAKYLVDVTTQDAVNDPLSAAEANQIILFNPDQFYNDNVMPQDLPSKVDRDQNPRTTNVQNPNPNAVYKIMVPFPADMKCEKCTLRLMQKMFDGGNLRSTVYTHCTDIKVLQAGSPNPAGNSPPAGVPTGLKLHKIPAQ